MTAKTNISSNARSKFVFTPLIWVAVIAGSLLFFRLGERPLRNPDEGRYAEIAREMSVSGDWVKPTVFGLGYLRKPPLFYWLTAGSFRLFGESEFTARAVPACFGLFGILLVYWFGCRYFDRSRALAAALILGTNLWFVQTARYLVIDAVYSFFLTASLFLFYAAIKESGKKIFPILFFACLGCAFLTKGPSALVIVGLPALAFLVLKKRWDIFRTASWWAGLALFVLVVSPWFVLMHGRDAGFLDFFFLHEHVQRFTAADFEHQEPWFYYLFMFPLLFLPWSLFRRSWAGPGADETKKFLWLAAGVILVFFSFSRTKLPTYILPCFPLMALLGADSWKRWTEAEFKASFADLFPVLLLCFASLAAIIGVPAFMDVNAEKFPKELAGDLQVLGGALLACSILCARSLKRRRPERFFFSLVFLAAVVSMFVPKLMETMNRDYTTRDFAEKLKPRLGAEDEVFVYDHPGPFYDFPFYLKHPVKLVGLEGEMAHFRQDEKAADLSVSREEFFSRIREGKPLAAIMRRSDYLELDGSLRAAVHILHQDRRKVLIQSGPES